MSGSTQKARSVWTGRGTRVWAELRRQTGRRFLPAVIAAAIVPTAITASGVCIHAQTPSENAFDVVSIKVRTGDRVGSFPSPPDWLVRPDITLRDLIRFGYDLPDFQIEGGPPWIASTRFDLRFRPKMTAGDSGRPGIATMTLIVNGVKMTRLAALLQNEVRRAIVDRTALAGTYDLELEFAPQREPPPGLPPGPLRASSDGSPLLTAIPEQLGLRLDAIRAPLPVLIVEARSRR
jgi:hypothetical protein